MKLRVCLSAALVLLPFQLASAAGMFIAPQGVRPLARGGAFVAGADDANAINYNPAAITASPNGVLADVGLPIQTSTYQRTVLNGDTAGYQSVEGKGLGLPSPSLGGVHDFHLIKGLRFGLGVSAAYPLLQNWPETKSNSAPAAQRYAIENYNGTAMVKMAAGGAYAITDWLSIGATFQLVAGNFGSQVRASACDGAICTQAENPSYDTVIQMRSSMIMVPGAQVGVLIQPLSWLRIGAAWESAYKIDHSAEFHIRLPTADVYQGAQLNTPVPKGSVAFTLPQVVRAGIEARYKELMRIEAAFVWENWSAHKKIDVNLGKTRITNVTGLQDYDLAPVTIYRGFRDTWSIRLGGEISPMIRSGRPLILRGGIMYEPSAVPNSTLTAMSVDLNKFMLAGGAAVRIGKSLFIEATYAHVFMFDRTVTNSVVFQANPTRPAWEGRTPIGNGHYSSHADIFGLGLRMLL